MTDREIRYIRRVRKEIETHRRKQALRDKIHKEGKENNCHERNA